jgi:hypothetical protein
MTVGAQHRIAARRRQRMVASLAALTAASAFGVFVVTRTPASPSEEAAPVPRQAVATQNPPQADEQPVPLDDKDLAALVDLADTDHTIRISAPWPAIERPLAPYKKLVKGVTP